MLSSPQPAVAVRTPRVDRRGIALAVEHSVFIAIPAVFMGWILLVVWSYRQHAVDFRLQFLPAGLSVLHGASPYAAAGAAIHPATAFPYPAATALLFAAFAALPAGLSGGTYIALCISAAPATLAVLRVRDVRLYGFVLLLGPVFAGWQTANLTLPLLLGVALVWRHRDRPAPAGALTALLISLKPFVWPLALWLLATRRHRAALWALAAGTAINLVAWAIVGFNQLSALARVTAAVTGVFQRWGYSAIALSMHFGASRVLATGLAALAAVALAVACGLGGRRGHERLALLLACDLMLVASPIVWSHYFALLLVPLGVLSPRFGLAWALQLAFWFCPVTEAATWQCLLALLVTATTSWLLARRDRADDLRLPGGTAITPGGSSRLAVTPGGSS